MINHGGDERDPHDAAGDRGGKGGSKGRAEAKTAAGDPCGGLPPRVVQKGHHRGRRSQRHAVAHRRRQAGRGQEVAVDAHVVHELGHVSTLTSVGA